ncbi:uncharacterized protein FA14DRAFT_185032 [Meira miltonrushii]|uniref:Uncharacterized protein n=1 Tax=Meira miltonrushii TaxID=1280837 RepID=A0A316VC97_9BASI|nr:uncharacterized protein FA14DRAFT_185032 [Meira miltonrushii]PWN33175.1 hypothetical protein FA14DRAFT_185032 [Meira miltonrushii]
MMISIFKLLCILALVVVCVDCVPVRPDRSDSHTLPFTGEQMETLLLAHQTARVHDLVDESKERRPQTPRRKFVAEQDLAKYDRNREFQHQYEKASEMAHYLLHERPIRHYEQKEKMQQQSLELHQAAHVRPLAIMGRNIHAKAADALLPKHFRD